MALQIGSVLGEAGHRVASRTGAILLGTLLGLLFGFQILFNTAMATWLTSSGFGEGVVAQLPLALDLPLSVAGGGLLVVYVLMFYHSIVSVRTFVAGDRDRFDPDALTRNLPLAALNIVVGSVVYSLIVFVGTVLLVVPGIFAYVALIFTLPYIVVEDRNFVGALRGSYRLTEGNRLTLFLLLVVVGAGAAVVGGAAGLVGGLALSQPGSQLLTLAVQGPIILYVNAVLAVAFQQLRDEGGDTPPATSTPSGASTAL